MTNNEEKIEANKRMIGKTVTVLDPSDNWTGIVSGVLDESTFHVIKNQGMGKKVDIFDLRSPS